MHAKINNSKTYTFSCEYSGGDSSSDVLGYIIVYSEEGGTGYNAERNPLHERFNGGYL
jgi:hypothetical protein